MRSTRKGTNPKNNREWQEAADHAEVMLLIQSARAYGLIAGGPEVNVDRCEELIKLARRRGIVPAKDCVEQYFAEYFKSEPTTGSQLVEKPR